VDERRTNRAALVSGIVFIVIGVAFLLERLEVWDFEFRYVAPLLLIALGVAVLLGGRSTRR
jgi:putative Mn2+ efflux pump MntP